MLGGAITYSAQLTDSTQPRAGYCICMQGMRMQSLSLGVGWYGVVCWRAESCWCCRSLGVTWRVKNQIFLECYCSTSTMLEIRIVKLWMSTSTSQRKDRKWSFSLKLLYVTGLLAWSQIIYKFIRKSPNPNPSSETNSKWLGENSK